MNKSGNNNKRKGKFTKGNYQRKTPDSKVSEQKYNDASWYVKDGQLAKDVASFSFNNALGAPSTLNFELYGNSGKRYSEEFVAPGIMTINTVPAIGFSGDGSSPINIAAKNIYSYVRHMNSGHANYDSPDLMMYLGAMDSIYSFISHLMRIYGVARVFSQTNRYVGDRLLFAMGVNPTEIRQNLSSLRSYINMFITKASAFCTPNIMTLYRRHFWMFSGVYKDEDIAKSQMYVYRPVSLWKYEELEGLGKLTAVPFLANATSSAGFVTTNWTLNEIYSYGNNMLAALTNSEDVNIMSGDILKAYGQGNLWQLGLINEDYAVLPVYSAEVLDQIHNTNFVGPMVTRGINVNTTEDPVFDITGLDVTQDPVIEAGGAIKFMPQFIQISGPAWSQLLDLHYENPTPEEVLVATRNKVMGQIISCKTKFVLDLMTCGSDIALTANVIRNNPSGGGLNSMVIGDKDSFNTGVTLYDKFKDAPILYSISASTDGGKYPGPFSAVYGELNNYTVLSFDDLRKMHESAILAQLGVPFYGISSTQQ